MAPVTPHRWKNAAGSVRASDRPPPAGSSARRPQTWGDQSVAPARRSTNP
ncbi:DUF4124 domain-containing protein [Pseudomonas neuropathica]